MNWNQVRLIFIRELRDQLRDRRTMFTICVMPLLLYPLMGMLMLQLAQVHRKQELQIAIIGECDSYPVGPAAREYEDSATNATVHCKSLSDDSSTSSSIAELLRENGLSHPPKSLKDLFDSSQVERLLKESEADAILCVMKPASEIDGMGPSPSFIVLSNHRWEKSQLATQHLSRFIDHWHQAWLKQSLEQSHINPIVLQPPAIEHIDIATAEIKQAIVWSKILPFVMLVWALTGAFYPAIDLCAGEKERGTLETLLCCPANRREIVWGKLITVMFFSFATAVLNLFSMHVTASLVMRNFAQLGASDIVSSMGSLPVESIGWLIVLALPMSAMFSALALAVASLARSTKEGQYYLMPLMLIGLPLVMLPMLPGMTLTTGTSIVPVTGAVLLSRALMDGEYSASITYFPLVMSVTTLCCLLSVRWAVRQFENESVLFPDTQRVTLRNWLSAVWQRRAMLPTATESMLCGLIILVTLFFGRLALGGSEISWPSIAKSTLTIQIGLILGPTLIVATIVSRSLRDSLRLRMPRLMDIGVSALLAICLHPTYVWFANLVSHEYQLGTETLDLLKQFDRVIADTPLLWVLLVLAVVPAICEELAFRGFVFTGLMENKGILRAVVGSALLFGLSHGVLQQSISASVMGLVLGWIAYRTGGVTCTIVYHMIHNSISMTMASCSVRKVETPYALSWAFDSVSGTWAYTSYWSAVSIAASMVLLFWLSTRLTHAHLMTPPSNNN